VPHSTPHARSVRSALPIALAGAVLSTVLFLVATHRWGVGVSADSVGYVELARHLLAGDVGQAISPKKPPGFVALLALAGALGLDPARALLPVNALAHGLTVLLCGLWMATRFRSLALAGAGTLALATAPLLLWLNTLALAEAVFGLFTMGSLLAAGRYLETGGRRPLLACAGLAALSVGTRIAGAPLLWVGGVIALVRPGASPRRRLADAALFSAVSLLIVVPWLAYLQATTGSVVGVRKPGSGDFGGVLLRMLGIVWGWFHGSGVYPSWFPDPPSPAIAEWAAALALAAGVAVAGYALRVRSADASRAWLGVAPLAAFAVVYLLFITIVKARVGAPEYRYFVPALAPLLMSILWALDRAGARLRAGGSPKWLAAAVPVCVLAWCGAHPVPQLVRLLDHYDTQGTGYYSGPAYEQARAIRFLRAPRFARLMDRGVTLYGNYPDILYWETGRPAVSLLRTVGEDEETAARAVLEQIDADATAGRVSVLVWIWFRNATRNTVTPERIMGAVRVVSSRKMADGSGFAVVADGLRPD